MDKTKLEKVNALRAAKIEPYPYSYDQTHHAGQIKEDFAKLEGKVASVAGRIVGMREMGKLYFIDLLDGSGKIQLIVKKDDLDSKSSKVISLIDIGDIIGAKGKIGKSKRGEVSIEATSMEMLAKSLLFLPEKFHGLTDIEIRYRKKYLDLIVNHENRKIFVKRAQIIKYIRDFLDEREFLEVDTPTLQAVYGGASAKPFVTHHNYLNTDLYLRIADELYLKRLIIGGMERVYEFAKDFRNEAVDATHNPEFTQLEFYQSYADYEEFANLIEQMLSGLVKKICGGHEVEYQGKKISFKAPFKRIYLVEEIKKKSGIDISKMDDESAAKIAKKEALDIPMKNAIHVADALFDKYVQPELINPTLVMDFPSYMCPLTKDKRGNPRLSERFEMFIAGKELGNCYSELTDPVEQRKKFEEQDNERKKGDTEAPPVDEDFLEAIEYGMPPLAGMGLGIDRLVMILSDLPSIKEAILFPTVKPEKK